jgi:hypothetical protein
VAAFDCNGEADEFVSELHGPAALKAYFFELKRIKSPVEDFICLALSLSRHHDA